MRLRFLADHCVSGYIIKSLKNIGHDVVTVKECMPADSSDSLVIAKAQELDRILVSLNGDFSDIVTYPPKQYKGIISLQVKNHPETIPRITELLMNLTEEISSMKDYTGKLFIIEAHRIRIRR